MSKTNEQLCARILELEEQNRLLLNENSALSESVQLYQKLLEEVKDPCDLIPPRTGQASDFRKGQRRRRQERASKILKEHKHSLSFDKITSDLSEDTLMVGTLNYLTALVKQLSLSKVKRNAIAPKNQEADDVAEVISAGAKISQVLNRGDALEDTIRHVFCDSLHLLTESIIDPESPLSKEIASHYESKEQSLLRKNGSHEVNNDPSSLSRDRRNYTQPDDGLRHPFIWLLDQFPILPKPSADAETIPYTCKDWLPLHWCVASDANELLDVETLLSFYGAEEFSALPMSPLLFGLAKPKPSLDVNNALLSFFSKNHVDQSVIRTPAEMFANAVGLDGVTPFHIAAAYNETPEMLQMLHKTCPQSIWDADARGWRSIHFAALKGKIAVVQWILGQGPKWVTSSTRNGQLPLHFAAQNQNQIDGESLLLLTEVFDKNPSAISVADASGAYPLHLAAKNGSLDVVQFLCQTYPKAMNALDMEGLLPMHYASSRSEQLMNKGEILQLLLS